MTTEHFDVLIHAPSRLRFCALPSAVADMEFKLLLDQLALSDSEPSKQMKMLDEANTASMKKRSQ